VIEDKIFEIFKFKFQNEERRKPAQRLGSYGVTIRNERKELVVPELVACERKTRLKPVAGTATHVLLRERTGAIRWSASSWGALSEFFTYSPRRPITHGLNPILD